MRVSKMSWVKVVKKDKKEYVMAVCDTCGKENYFLMDRFLTALVIGGGVHCKYCGSPLQLSFDRNMERRIQNFKKRRHAS